VAQRQPVPPGPQPGTAGPAVTGPSPAPAAPTGAPAAAKPDPLEVKLARIEKEFDDKIKAHPFFDNRAKRIKFLDFERPFFGSDEATIDHFAKIGKVEIPGSVTLMHEEANKRLVSVAAEMGKKMPHSSGNGWAFRSPFGAGKQDVSDFHRIGFAIDYNAAETPHLGKRAKVVDPRQMDLISIVTGRVAQMKFPSETKLLEQLRKMGEASLLTDAEAKAKVLTTKESTDILATIRSEAEALEKASAAFQDSLGTDGAKLAKLQKDYFATSDAKQRADIFAQVPALLTVWTSKLDGIVKTMEADIAATGEKLADLPVGAALDKAAGATKDHAGKVGSALVALEAPPPKKGAKAKRRADPMAAATKAIAAARTALAEPAWQAPAPGADADAAAELKAATVAELERLAGRLAQRGTALGKKAWRDRVLAVRNALTSDVTFVFGRQKDKKALPEIEVGNPPVAQLVDRGFFTTKSRSKSPSTAFEVDFMEVMARHGFAPGARFSHPDSMHFELFWPGGK
jgi:hypothetical protein